MVRSILTFSIFKFWLALNFELTILYDLLSLINNVFDFDVIFDSLSVAIDANALDHHILTFESITYKFQEPFNMKIDSNN